MDVYFALFEIILVAANIVIFEINYMVMPFNDCLFSGFYKNFCWKFDY